MHEVSLGGMISDYLSGEERELTTYEDLRQALARFLVEERGFSPARLRPRFAVGYEIDGERMEREADVALLAPDGKNPEAPSDRPCLLFVFCPGQVHTYAREVTALARLALPAPCPLAVVTDMREAELFSVHDGRVLARGLDALPNQAAIDALAREHPHLPLGAAQRERESRILHAYTGFLKTCCGENCPL